MPRSLLLGTVLLYDVNTCPRASLLPACRNLEVNRGGHSCPWPQLEAGITPSYHFWPDNRYQVNKDVLHKTSSFPLIPLVHFGGKSKRPFLRATGYCRKQGGPRTACLSPLDEEQEALLLNPCHALAPEGSSGPRVAFTGCFVAPMGTQASFLLITSTETSSVPRKCLQLLSTVRPG